MGGVFTHATAVTGRVSGYVKLYSVIIIRKHGELLKNDTFLESIRAPSECMLLTISTVMQLHSTYPAVAAITFVRVSMLRTKSDSLH